MPHSGSGTSTPVVPVVPGIVAYPLVRPFPYTLLSPDRYARVMGITPAHFWQAIAPNLNPQVFPEKTCKSIWYKYDWQSADKVARLDIAMEIKKAEQEISQALGYWPAPTWIADENCMYPRDHRRDMFGTGADIRGLAKSVQTRYAKIVSVGRRAVTAVGTATVVGASLAYTDEDSDGCYETATVAVPTTLTDICELHVYYAGALGDIDYEIREPRKKYITGGFAYFIFDSWLFIDPNLYEAFPDDSAEPAIDISTTANFVTSVDVYREYADTTTDPAVEFYWENAAVGCASCGGVGCDSCGAVTQDGCLRLKDKDVGLVVPFPAEYDSTTGIWGAVGWTTECREPDYLRLWYRAGLQSFPTRRGTNCEGLSDEWAKVIAHMVTARLERPLCECSNVEAVADYLRQDTTKMSQGSTFFVSMNMLDNPFGTKVGEIQAWKFITKLQDRQFNYAII